jgi:hypothetical protein
MKFFLPNFEDMVDPEYDFIRDQPSKKRKNRWEHDRFAHEFYSEPIFDGMLVSKASLTPSAEKHILRAGGVREFTRLDPQLPTMADCGAFTYILEENPIYTVQQVLDYYRDFGFDYGVSLDHLAFVTIEMLEGALKSGKVKEKWWDGKTTKQIQEERIELTLRNAQEFLDLHADQKPGFVPIGIAQGSSPDRYYGSVEKLIRMGYEYIALGGLVRSSDAEIIAILTKIQPLIRDGIKLHIFGVARLPLIKHFMRLGVTSVDTASPLRRAFLGSGEDNYWTLDGHHYAAIRIPESRTNRRKRGVNHPEEILSNGNLPINSLDDLAELEKRALDSIRAYDNGGATLSQTLDAVLTYDRLFGEKRDHEAWYRRTLEDKPWQKCNCEICTQIEVEVIIFRGNNRNRRRGFHNVKIFYDQFRAAIDEFSEIPFGSTTPESNIAHQLPLNLPDDIS